MSKRILVVGDRKDDRQIIRDEEPRVGRALYGQTKPRRLHHGVTDTRWNQQVAHKRSARNRIVWIYRGTSRWRCDMDG
jgi:hypothetical protein